MWYIITALIINLIIICFMPKRLSKKEIYLSWLIIAFIAFYSDVFFGVVIDLYDFGKPNVQFSDMLVDALLPASYGIIFLNFLPSDRKKSLKYIIYWTIFSVVFEIGSVLFGFEDISKGWKPWFYSPPIYFLVFVFLRWNLHYIRKR